EDRGLVDGRAPDPAAVEDVLDELQQRVDEADEGDDDGNVEVGPADGEAVADEQAHPGEEVAALPDARHPFLLAGGPVCGTGGRRSHRFTGAGRAASLSFWGRAGRLQGRILPLPRPCPAPYNRGEEPLLFGGKTEKVGWFLPGAAWSSGSSPGS